MSDTQVSKENMPGNATDWAKFLLSHTLATPFKLGRLVVGDLDQQHPYRKIAAQLSHDPVLSFYIMNEANRGRPSGNPTSKTLDHAISMIGTDELQRLIKNLPQERASKTDVKSVYYLRMLSSSIYAAHLGQEIARHKNQGNPEDIYWSSMFLGVPLWYLWRVAAPEMRLVRYAIRTNFKPAQQAEREVLQCSVLDICAEMTRQMHLPDLTTQCFNPELQPERRQWLSMARAAKHTGTPALIEDRDIAMLVQHPEFIVMLANLVAHYAVDDWYSRGCLRVQRILATYLHVPLSEAIALTHRAAAAMSREHPIPGLMLPAAKLFLPPRPRKQVTVASPAPATASAAATEPASPSATSSVASAASPKAETAPEHEAAVSPAAAPSLARDGHEPQPAQEEAVETETPLRSASEIFEPSEMFRELTDIMHNSASDFTDLHELMNAATQGIAYGLNLARATVSLVNRDNTRIKTYYSVGCRDHKELATFETPVVKNTIFDKLISRPASVWIKPNSGNKVTKLIPMNFKQVTQVDECFLMSVFVGKKPVAVFYADNFHGPALVEGQYSHFKYLCGAVTNALTVQARQQASQKKARTSIKKV